MPFINEAKRFASERAWQIIATLPLPAHHISDALGYSSVKHFLTAQTNRKTLPWDKIKKVDELAGTGPATKPEPEPKIVTVLMYYSTETDTWAVFASDEDGQDVLVEDFLNFPAAVKELSTLNIPG